MLWYECSNTGVLTEVLEKVAVTKGSTGGLKWARQRSSFMGLGFGGESEIEASPARSVVGSPQPPAVRFNDGAANPKSHTGAVNFRGEECVKDLVRLPRRQPHAG